MATFSYVAKNKDGQEVRSVIDASTRLDALECLRKKGLTVVDLVEVEGAFSDSNETANTVRGKQHRVASARVKMTDLALFCRQLAIAVNAGVPLRDALETIGAETEQATLKKAAEEMVADLNKGKSFSAAVAEHPRIFNVMFRGLVKVAEESGRLPSVLQQLAGYLERTDKLRRRIRAMAAYPIFIAVFFLVVCLVMTLFILPQFSDIFGGLNAQLPFFTRLVFSVNAFFVDHILEIFIGVMLLIVAGVVYVRTPTGAYQKDRLKLWAPYTGDLVMKYVLARFCRSMSIMVNSGVPISTALEICAEATGNRVLERTVMIARERILAGSGIAAGFDACQMFPGLVVRMVRVGEDSGQLPEVLERVAELYEDQVEVSIMTFMALFEPLVICVFGSFVLMLVLAIYLPIFSVSANVR